MKMFLFVYFLFILFCFLLTFSYTGTALGSKVAVSLTLLWVELLPDPTRFSIPTEQLVLKSKNSIHLHLRKLQSCYWGEWQSLSACCLPSYLSLFLCPVCLPSYLSLLLCPAWLSVPCFYQPTCLSLHLSAGESLLSCLSAFFLCHTPVISPPVSVWVYYLSAWLNVLITTDYLSIPP